MSSLSTAARLLVPSSWSGGSECLLEGAEKELCRIKKKKKKKKKKEAKGLVGNKLLLVLNSIVVTIYSHALIPRNLSCRGQTAAGGND